MNDYLWELIQKYKQKGLLVDTNIILLYIVGSLDISIIRNFSRTSGFTEDDFERVSGFIEYFDIKITTPHILTEVNDLIGNRTDLQFALRTYLTLSTEIFLESSKVSDNKFFVEFGLADTAIMETANNSYLVFTEDWKFYGLLENSKIDVVNLAQVRMI